MNSFNILFIHNIFINLEMLNSIFTDLIFFYKNNGFLLLNYKDNNNLSRNCTLNFMFKFIAATSLLILVRGGTPRYRYDYLTKLG